MTPGCPETREGGCPSPPLPINYPSRDVLSYRLGKSLAGTGGKYIGIYSLGLTRKRNDMRAGADGGLSLAAECTRARNSHPALPDHTTARVQFLTVACTRGYCFQVHFVTSPASHFNVWSVFQKHTSSPDSTKSRWFPDGTNHFGASLICIHPFHRDTFEAQR